MPHNFGYRTWINQDGTELEMPFLLARFNSSRRCCSHGWGKNSMVSFNWSHAGYNTDSPDKGCLLVQQWPCFIGANQPICDCIGGLLYKREHTSGTTDPVKADGWEDLGPKQRLNYHCVSRWTWYLPSFYIFMLLHRHLLFSGWGKEAPFGRERWLSPRLLFAESVEWPMSAQPEIGHLYHSPPQGSGNITEDGAKLKIGGRERIPRNAAIQIWQRCCDHEHRAAKDTRAGLCPSVFHQG